MLRRVPPDPFYILFIISNNNILYVFIHLHWVDQAHASKNISTL